MLRNLVAILALAGCAATQHAPSAKTTAVVIGTLHGIHFRSAWFHPDEVRRMLAAARPDVLAVEARPEDLAAADLGQAPDDIKQIVVPWARRHHVPVQPIDWFEEGTRAKVQAFYRDLSATEEGRQKLAALPDETAVHADKYPDFDAMPPAYVESAEFAEKDRMVREKTTAAFGEGPGNLYWGTRAARMNELLGGVLAGAAGMRVVVVTGAAHRGDLERWLATRADVTLVPASTLVAAAPAAYTGAEADDSEVQVMLLGLVQGPKANRSPDAIDLAFVAHVVEVAKRRPELRPTVAFAEAEVLYLGRKYDAALDSFAAAKALAGDARVFGLPLAELCELRRGHMLDLLGRRDEALAVYRGLPADGPFAKMAAKFVDQPFARPGGSPR